ncbi:MAG: membrane-bound lytic murein transglycosylase MltF [Halobacteria archaeon]|nr:membrane-bound lytic murein transglycosylase MltF [Halobacteria archaeon]
MLGACGKPPSLLEQVQSRNELIVITRNSPTTYYEGVDGPTGFEYELAKGFADYLGVELRVVVPPNFTDILPLVARGDGHLAAAGLTVTNRRKLTVRFGPVYQEITPQLIYRMGSVRPKTFDDLEGHLEVVAGSSHVERLEILRSKHPELSWQENEQLESEELLTMVWQQLIDYTIADSNELSINRRFYPELRPAFDISSPRALAWAFSRRDDDSLYNAAVDYFATIRKDGSLEQLIERYYGHITEFDYVGTRRYQAHIEQRLPTYLDIFKQAGELVGMDWRLIAAISYQESHWDKDAVSPTGVRGLMMLTQAAAKDLGIENRLDPTQSILGGARYFERMREKIPERITEPDRTWLALAAYNVGYGHLEDARILTQKNEGDSDKWIDVKENLPLLSQKKWYKQTRYGYARGREPVRYVENIRSYYDILIWYTDREVVEDEVSKPMLFDSPAL